MERSTMVGDIATISNPDHYQARQWQIKTENLIKKRQKIKNIHLVCVFVLIYSIWQQLQADVY